MQASVNMIFLLSKFVECIVRNVIHG